MWEEVLENWRIVGVEGKQNAVNEATNETRELKPTERGRGIPAEELPDDRQSGE